MLTFLTCKESKPVRAGFQSLIKVRYDPVYLCCSCMVHEKITRSDRVCFYTFKT
jgi:hypothetical protein